MSVTASRVSRAALLSALVLLITACATTSPSLPADDPALARIADADARRLLIADRPGEAADRYTEIANAARDPFERQDALLLAAEILLDRGMLERARAKLAALPPVMTTRPLEQRRRIVVAQGLLLDGEGRAALETLPAVSEVDNALHRLRLQEVRALAYIALDDPGEALAARIELGDMLRDEAAIARNQAAIWQLLQSQPIDTLRRMTTNVRSDTYQGWIELALAEAEAGRNAARRAELIGLWERRFPDHPARRGFLPELLDDTAVAGLDAARGPVEQIDVLLPLSDPATAAVAAAIRDGLVAAHGEAARRRAVPTLRFHDVGPNPAHARAAYREAVDGGADVIIGPLRKAAVTAIATQQDIPVPTLTLNTVENVPGDERSPNLVQFGLAPEDEAEAAASRAAALSLDRAIVLQSDDTRGDRETRAFQEMLYRLGGDVVHVAVLPREEYDYSDQIRQALRITEGDTRFRTLSAVIGRELFFEPVIRDDVDMIFIAVDAAQARSVAPQLDYYRAGDVPRYATSRVASVMDDERLNDDLDGIVYPDIPWILDASLQDDPLRRSIVSNFPGADGVFARLYALGADAFTLATALDRLAEGETLSGYTGELRLDGGGRVDRRLDWARYRNGMVVAAEPVDIPTLPEIRSGGQGGGIGELFGIRSP